MFTRRITPLALTCLVAAGATGCAAKNDDGRRISIPATAAVPTIIDMPPVVLPNTAARPRTTPPVVPLLPVDFLDVGDCLDKLVGKRVERVAETPCALPHRGEVASSFDSAAKDWPGRKQLAAEANRRCSPTLLKAGERVLRKRRVTLSYLYPPRARWSEDDREILCIATTKRPFSGRIVPS